MGARGENQIGLDLEDDLLDQKMEEEAAELERFVLRSDINPMVEVMKAQERLSLIKAKLPLDRLLVLGFLSGWWLGFATIFSCSIAGGVPVATRTAWPMIPKIITGFLFPVAIFFISLFGGELFTGNAMTMMIGYWTQRITFRELMYNWVVVLLMNFVGCVVTVFFFGYVTQLFQDEPWNSYVRGVAVLKINMPPVEALLRGVAANVLVSVCILLGGTARDMFGKLLGMWFPIVVFAASGFEHAIANMAYVPLGLMYGADASAGKWFYQNLAITIMGKVVGGAVMMGMGGCALYDWTKLPTPHTPKAVPEPVKVEAPPAPCPEPAPPAPQTPQPDPETPREEPSSPQQGPARAQLRPLPVVRRPSRPLLKRRESEERAVPV